MDIFEFLFPLAVVIIGVVQWFIENRKKAAEQDGRDDDPDIPEWAWPSEEEEPAPPPLPSTPPPPPAPRSQPPTVPQPPVGKKSSPASGHQGSLSALQHKIAEAKKRRLEAEAQRIKFTTKPSSSPKRTKPAKSPLHGVNWLSDPESLRRAVIAREILGPPLALRKGSDIDDR